MVAEDRHQQQVVLGPPHQPPADHVCRHHTGEQHQQQLGQQAQPGHVEAEQAVVERRHHAVDDVEDPVERGDADDERDGDEEARRRNSAAARPSRRSPRSVARTTTPPRPAPAGSRRRRRGGATRGSAAGSGWRGSRRSPDDSDADGEDRRQLARHTCSVPHLEAGPSRRAATTAGMPSRKVKRAAASRRTPSSMPTVMVLPERDMPGNQRRGLGQAEGGRVAGSGRRRHASAARAARRGAARWRPPTA